MQGAFRGRVSSRQYALRASTLACVLAFRLEREQLTIGPLHRVRSGFYAAKPCFHCTYHLIDFQTLGAPANPPRAEARARELRDSDRTLHNLRIRRALLGGKTSDRKNT